VIMPPPLVCMRSEIIHANLPLPGAARFAGFFEKNRIEMNLINLCILKEIQRAYPLSHRSNDRIRSRDRKRAAYGANNETTRSAFKASDHHWRRAV
jgi:hypothetical protein